MHSRVVSVSKCGQVTIPAVIRKALGIESPGQVEFVVRNDGVVVRRAPAFTLDDVVGSVPFLPGESPHLVREIREAGEAACMERHEPHQHG